MNTAIEDESGKDAVLILFLRTILRIDQYVNGARKRNTVLQSIIYCIIMYYVLLLLLLVFCARVQQQAGGSAATVYRTASSIAAQCAAIQGIPLLGTFDCAICCVCLLIELRITAQPVPVVIMSLSCPHLLPRMKHQ